MSYFQNKELQNDLRRALNERRGEAVSINFDNTSVHIEATDLGMVELDLPQKEEVEQKYVPQTDDWATYLKKAQANYRYADPEGNIRDSNGNVVGHVEPIKGEN
jgi:hypothetical protein